jgi:hypothetical protein
MRAGRRRCQELPVNFQRAAVCLLRCWSESLVYQRALTSTGIIVAPGPLQATVASSVTSVSQGLPE